METKHTKGQWRFSEQYNCITTSRKGIIEGSKTICDINTNVSFGDNIGEAEANAKLIAASPELLELAQQIILAAENEEQLPFDILASAKRLVQKATE